MNKERAKRILLMLDRINQEIDVLGKTIFNKNLKPAPIKVKSTDKIRFR